MSYSDVFSLFSGRIYHRQPTLRINGDPNFFELDTKVTNNNATKNITPQAHSQWLALPIIFPSFLYGVIGTKGWDMHLWAAILSALYILAPLEWWWIQYHKQLSRPKEVEGLDNARMIRRQGTALALQSGARWVFRRPELPLEQWRRVE